MNSDWYELWLEELHDNTYNQLVVKYAAATKQYQVLDPQQRYQVIESFSDYRDAYLYCASDEYARASGLMPALPPVLFDRPMTEATWDVYLLLREFLALQRKLLTALRSVCAPDGRPISLHQTPHQLVLDQQRWLIEIHGVGLAFIHADSQLMVDVHDGAFDEPDAIEHWRLNLFVNSLREANLDALAQGTTLFPWNSATDRREFLQHILERPCTTEGFNWQPALDELLRRWFLRPGPTKPHRPRLAHHPMHPDWTGSP